MTTTDLQPLAALEITNQCVVVCDLASWTVPESAAWILLCGSQDEVGTTLARMLDQRRVRRLDDFGGACKTFLCDGDTYLDSPPRTKEGGCVFSFTPKKRLTLEANEMARVSRKAGYGLLILTVQKHGKFGKAWVLTGVLRHCDGDPLVYYDDTNTVVDELKAGSDGHRVHAVHVQAPGYAQKVSRLADRVVTQRQYQDEVLRFFRRADG